ncbi:hypothetical protein FZEAL_1634 [Fusarium zealandicum]|uniref:CFEM domain-containing protein n=1 Tax=Fusarium zealandicum TaxID=1053134 RepID=A0A8H4USF0_9HYPO|nr:hypothetical protein FZEAL_1634 [Fusarium zealandicum]
MKWIVPLLAVFMPFWVAAAADISTKELLAELPQCARSCLGDAVTNSDCDADDTTCICTSKEILSVASVCVAGSCTVRESLTTQNMTNTYCDVPVRDRTSLFINVSIILGVISGISILLRIGSKFLITNSAFGLDDLFILITFAFGVPATAMNVHGTAGHGEGRDIWTLEFDDITKFGFYFWLLEILYFAEVAFLKMSLIFFYLRIFLGPAQKWLWGTVTVNAIYGVAFVCLAVFQCSPVSFFWTRWDGTGEGNCTNVNAIGWANAAISIALDIWMLAIPMWYLRNLKMHWKKKIGVAAMFTVGTFVTIVSIVRLQFIVDLDSSQNPTYDQTDVSIWSTVEINVGIICASMPALRILIVRLFPVLGGTTYDSSNYNNNYGDQYGRKSQIMSRNRTLVELPSRGDSVNTPEHGGIQLQRTFKAEYGDEQSLVNSDRYTKGHVTSGQSTSEVSL